LTKCSLPKKPRYTAMSHQQRAAERNRGVHGECTPPLILARKPPLNSANRCCAVLGLNQLNWISVCRPTGRGWRPASEWRSTPAARFSGAVPAAAGAFRGLRDVLMCLSSNSAVRWGTTWPRRGRILAAFVRRLQITGVKYRGVVQQVEDILALRPGSRIGFESLHPHRFPVNAKAPHATTVWRGEICGRIS
jgi:hypothetical protein